MRIIPVIDLKGGLVVRGVGGRREEYRPVVSRLTDSAEPLAVGRALLETFRPRELYLADLDALAGAEPARDAYAALRSLGVALWVDAGLRDAADAEALAAAGIEGVVVGLETIQGPEALRRVVRAVGSERVVFSLDMKAGLLLGDFTVWGVSGPADAMGIAKQVAELGVSRLIVLDLARVGGGEGTGTEELCRHLAATHPGVELIAGGGVAGGEDLRRLEACGVAGALVASALHDGRIRPG